MSVGLKRKKKDIREDDDFSQVHYVRKVTFTSWNVNLFMKTLVFAQ